ncbi:MAG: D-amino acid aminotransferase, partial [Proteobacteria bacterium]|nr:D-amino acid aminotransferase [Pseudomonadota bacterium]
MTVYLNGQFMPIEEARIPVLDRGFIFGDGIY